MPEQSARLAFSGRVVMIGDGDAVLFRPTVHYAYHPCGDAVLSLHEFAGRSWEAQTRQHILMDEISSGRDELGVLLAGHARNAYWYGSRLSIGQARALAPYNTATSLQVCAAVLAGMIWAIEHPARGIVKPDELDHAGILALAAPYLGELVGAYGAWHPLVGRSRLFTEQVGLDDPWQFRNVLVS